MVKFTPILVLFLLFSCLNTSFAQYNPRFLIPYKSDKLWGWSDTSGTLVINPKYKDVAFFDKINLQENYFLATLGDGKDGYYYVKLNGDLLFPTGLRYKPNEPDSSKLSELNIVEDTNKKKGIFSFSLDRMVVEANQDEVFFYMYNNVKYALIKKDTEKHYQILNSKREIQKTKIVSFFTLFSEVIYTDSRNKHGYLRGEEFEPMSNKEFKSSSWGYCALTIRNHHQPFTPPIAVNCVPASEMTERNQSFERVTGKKFINQNIYCGSKELSNTTYYVVKENNKEGVFTQSGVPVVTIKYDKIEFTEDTPGVSLLNNGKYGFMQLPVQFPVIEPKYNSPLSFERMLYGTKGEKFYIYKVKRNDNYVFVGQNGIEFFKD